MLIAWASQQPGQRGGGSPPPTGWILATGFWDDSAPWVDTESWID